MMMTARPAVTCSALRKKVAARYSSMGKQSVFHAVWYADGGRELEMDDVAISHMAVKHR